MLIYKNRIIPHIYKTAGTSVYTRIQKDPDNIQFITWHGSLNVLKKLDSEYVEALPQLSLVRHPVRWYESMYNYLWINHNPISYEPIFNFLLFPFPNKKDFPSIDEFLERALDLKKFFDEDNRLEKYRKTLAQQVNSIISHDYFPDLDNIDFKNEGLYSLMVRKTLRNNCSTFKLESELSDFLNAIEISRISRLRTTKYYWFFHSIHKEKIFEKEQNLFKRFQYSFDI